MLPASFDGTDFDTDSGLRFLENFFSEISCLNATPQRAIGTAGFP